MIGLQVVEFVPRMRHAPVFRDAGSEQRLILTEIIADQGASPSVEKLSGKSPSATFGKVEYHRLHRIVAGAAIALLVSVVCLAIPGLSIDTGVS